MEKHTPHCKLTVVKNLVKAGRVRMTWSALTGAAALGFDRDEIMDVIMNLTTAHFHKSMTTHHDHTVWQDVYRIRIDNWGIYLKLTVSQEVLVVSFKEI